MGESREAIGRADRLNQCVPVRQPSRRRPSMASDFIVTITNFTTFSWTDLFFVADAGIFVGNADGKIKDGEAFKIDKTGINTPLISESMARDFIFEPGESWTFIVQDWDLPRSPTSRGASA